MSTFNTKRTRSQLTLPALNHSVLGRSPLKDARSALRNASNTQVQFQRPHSKLHIIGMDGEDADEDEILLSPNKKAAHKNRKRSSEEFSKGENVDRGSKRHKMDPLPSLVLTSADAENIHPGSKSSQQMTSHLDREQPVKSSSELQRARSVPPSPAHSPPVPHLDLKTVFASPWRSGSPVKNGSMLKPDAKHVTPDANTSVEPLANPRIPAPAFTAQIPQMQTPKKLGSDLVMGPMSPLTPLPPTPALFGGGPIRAFTSGKREGVGIGEGWGVPAKRTEHERSKMNVVVTNSDSALSTLAGPSTSQLTQPPPPSQNSTGLPTSKSNPTVSTAAKIVVKNRGRSAAVVSNGAGAWGPKPKTPTVLKLRSVKATNQAAGTRGGRVTRSVSMKEKQKEVLKDEDSGDTGMRKSFSFSFKAPVPSEVVEKTAANKKMKQMSMKDFIARPSSKSKVPSPTKPKPAWNASAGSPSKARQNVKPQSSLSTLSIALEKLAMPRPVRPNTSMGFTDTTVEEKGKERSVDDGSLGRKREGMVNLGVGGVGGRGLKRSATVGDNSFSKMVDEEDGTPSGSKNAVATPAVVSLTHSTDGNKSTIESSTNASTVTSSSPAKGGNSSPKRPSSIFAPQVGPSIRQLAMKNTTLADRGSKVFGHGPMPGIFGSGRGGIVGNGALGRKVSKKTSLPSVMDSPVKGGGGWNPIGEGAENDSSAGVDGGDVSMRNAAGTQVVINDEESETGKGKERSKDGWKQNASMRASMASQSLTQSLSSIPRTPSKGSMGPPRTPGRSASSTYPTVTSGSKDKREEGKQQIREDTVICLKSAPSALGRVRSGTEGHVGTSRSARIFAQEKLSEPEVASEGNEEKGSGVLNVLKECIIFVDVRTDGGDDAGGLFVDMLKGMGARILTRVGPSCTHIVYKNGLMSTLTRYRLLQDAKPFVVGIGWVVECVEQRARVDEARFHVDLDGMNVAGTNKRRRSMLPKLASGEEGSELSEGHEGHSSQVDVSMEATDADSSMKSIDTGDLPPLEKARRRRLLLSARA